MLADTAGLSLDATIFSRFESIVLRVVSCVDSHASAQSNALVGACLHRGVIMFGNCLLTLSEA